MPRSLLAAILLLAPAVPAAPAGGVRYLGDGGTGEVLRALLGARPDSTAPVRIGESLCGRPIEGVLVGLPGEVPVAERPRLLVVAGLEADRRAGTAVAAALPRLLLEAGEKDPAVADLLRRTALEVLPLLNPDGLAALLAGPEREFTTNVRPVDTDRDRRTDEDGPDDLDGDGRILAMRVPDPAGPWRVSPEDPRLLVRADAAAGELGTFRLLPEGVDGDEDGELDEDPEGGVVLDRNFPHGWREHDRLAGTSPPSEPESRALIDHFLASPTVAAVLVYGRHENLAAPPPPNQGRGPVPPDGPLPEDHAIWREASRRYVRATGAGGAADDRPDGAFHQWVYAERGLPAFATTLWRLPDAKALPALPSGRAPASEEGRLLAWLDAHGGGFVPWRPFDHPTLGRIEIGGFPPLSRKNPPEALLPDLARDQARFVVELLRMLPAIAFREASAREIGPGVYVIRATLRSEGVFPAVSAMAERTRAGMPIRVSLDVPADRIIHGRARALVHRLGGAGDTRSFRFVVRGEPGAVVALRAVSDPAGDAAATVTLPGGGR